jgi:predicted RNA-binding Zn-ribbon protein involved in translation (DUF1610 family)
MTIYHDKNRRGREPADTPIVASYNNNTSNEYVCPECNRTMIKLQDRNSANISYFCNACNIQTNAEETDNLRTRSRLQMPEGVNTTPYTSNKFPDYSVGKTPPPVRGNFAELQRWGIKIKNYKDTVKDN